MMTTDNRTSSYFGKPINPEDDLHPVDWKSGTEALALCMICGGEYPVDKQECPDCNVSLSVVRRCPHCLKIVSAQHRKCVYCHTPFTNELPQHHLALDLPYVEATGVSPAVRRFRAAMVSVTTFAVVFILGMFFLRQISQPHYSPQVIATARLLHSTELRRAPSTTSSNIASPGAGTTLSLIGFESNDQGRWMTVEWKGRTAYLPVNDLAAPYASDADAGAAALKFYISGMDAGAAEQAVKAVDSYAEHFPRQLNGKDLRKTLADRLQALAQGGGDKAADLRRMAGQQYELLGSKAPVSAPPRENSSAKRPARRSRQASQTDGVQIIGGSGTSVTPPQPAARHVLVTK